MVNALPIGSRVTVRRDGQVYDIAFERGERCGSRPSPAPADAITPAIRCASGQSELLGRRFSVLQARAPAQSQGRALPGPHHHFLGKEHRHPV